VCAGVDTDQVSLAKLSLENRQCKRVEDPALDGPLERPRTVDRIVSFLDDEVTRFVGQLDPELPLFQAAEQRRQLNVDDLADLGPPERVEEDDVVDAVQELGLEMLAQRVQQLPPHALIQPGIAALRTFNGSEVVVPNGELISNRLINWTLSDRRRRLEITVGVAYGSDLDQVHMPCTP